MSLHRLCDYVSLLFTDDSLHQWLAQFVVHRTPTKKKENWSKIAKNQIKATFNILNSNDWTQEKINGSDVIYSRNAQNVGKVFKLEGIIDCSVERLRDKLFYNVEKSPEWNSNVKDVKIIQKIDKMTCIMHITAYSYHMISSRDFVHLRTCGQEGNSFFLSSVSISHPKVSEKTNVIRGEHRVFMYLMAPATHDPSKTHFIWLMNVNLNGWLPQKIIDQTLSSAMLDHLKDIRSFVQK